MRGPLINRPRDTLCQLLFAPSATAGTEFDVASECVDTETFKFACSDTEDALEDQCCMVKVS